MTILYIDCETYSELELKTAGTFRYAEECEIMIVVWAVEDGTVHCWDRSVTREFPEQLKKDLNNCTEIWAHNMMFDSTVLKYSGVLDLPFKKLRCSLVQALSHGLPGGLEDLCGIYKVGSDKAKIKDGRRLIPLFCKPRPKNSKIARATRETHPEEWARFIEYACNDIEAMREIHKKLPRWNYPREPELSHWHLDQQINDRGFAIDRELCEAVIRAIGRAKEELSDKTVELTDGRLASTTQVQATIDYILEEHGIYADNLTKANVKKLLDSDIPQELRLLLETRQQASASSTAKYQALLNKASSDGRFRGGVQFSGASRTRRACLAEGSMIDVKTYDGEITQKPIQDVLVTDMVWDGVEWVNHEGVVFSGLKSVVTHDGVVATGEHIVWTDETNRVTMAEAKQKGLKLWLGNIISTD